MSSGDQINIVLPKAFNDLVWDAAMKARMRPPDMIRMFLKSSAQFAELAEQAGLSLDDMPVKMHGGDRHKTKSAHAENQD